MKIDETHMFPDSNRINGYIVHNNYIKVYKPSHPNKNNNNYISLHRLVMEFKIGRLLTHDEIVHHKDGNKFNNLPDNLEVMTRSQHITLHNNQLSRYSTKLDLEKITNLYLNGLSIRDIATLLNESKSNVAYFIKKLNISRKNIQSRDNSGKFSKRSDLLICV